MAKRAEILEKDQYVILLTDKERIGAAMKAVGKRKNKDGVFVSFSTDDPRKYARFNSLKEAEDYRLQEQEKLFRWRWITTLIGEGPAGVDMSPKPEKTRVIRRGR